MALVLVEEAQEPQEPDTDLEELEITPLKRHKRRKRRKNQKKEWWNKKLLLLPAALIVLCCALFALRERDSLTIAEPVKTCVGGDTLRFEEGVHLIRKNGKTTMKEGETLLNSESYPLLTNDGRIILQKSFAWNKTEDNGAYRVDYFTELSYENGKVRMERRGKSADTSNGFLYDNQDTYIFLEKATLYIGGKNGRKINLTPMSIVQCSANFDRLQIFGPGKNTFYENNLETDEVVAVFAGKRRVNVALDHYYMENGIWRLLFRAIEELKGMEQEDNGSEEK